MKDEKSGTKTLKFFLDTIVDTVGSHKLSDKAVNLESVMDIFRNGNKMTTRKTPLCPIDDKSDDEGVCEAGENNRLTVRRAATIPRYVFSGEYQAKGTLQLNIDKNKFVVAYLEAHFTI